MRNNQYQNYVNETLLYFRLQNVPILLLIIFMNSDEFVYQKSKIV